MKKEKKQTRIPKKAREEMHAILSGDAKVPAEALEQVLIKYKVSSPVAQLREQDRKRRVQRFSARYRDTDGCRDVLAHLDRDANRAYYITIENCTDMAVLEEIIDRLNSNIRGLRASAKKAAYRRNVLLLRDCYQIQPRPSRRRTVKNPHTPKNKHQ